MDERTFASFVIGALFSCSSGLFTLWKARQMWSLQRGVGFGFLLIGGVLLWFGLTYLGVIVSVFSPTSYAPWARVGLPVIAVGAVLAASAVLKYLRRGGK